MYPAGGVATFRRSKTGKDVVLGGGKLVLPAGVGLHMPITAVHHTQGIWENPHAFTPERFLEVCGTRLSPVAGGLGVSLYMAVRLSSEGSQLRVHLTSQGLAGYDRRRSIQDDYDMGAWPDHSRPLTHRSCSCAGA